MKAVQMKGKEQREKAMALILQMAQPSSATRKTHPFHDFTAYQAQSNLKLIT